LTTDDTETLPIASAYLRLLESRGLLKAHRVGRRVEYRVAPTTRAGPHAKLIPVLRSVFARNARPAHIVFRLVTALTHPRRIKIFCALRAGPSTLDQIRFVTRVSSRALLRHFEKLEARGFIRHRQGVYSIVKRWLAYRVLIPMTGWSASRVVAQFEIYSPAHTLTLKGATQVPFRD
jgi:DNA-binding transcriptional ArsR family regulator